MRMKIKFNETSVASKRQKKEKKFPMGGRGVEERSDMHLHPERYSLDDSFSSENGLHYCIPV